MEATDNSELWDQLTQPADINSSPDKIILDITNVIAPSDVTIWYELSDEEAYKCAPRSRMNLHRNSSPKYAFPGWMCIAKLFFTNYLEKPILKKHRVKYIETYLDEYINGWDNFQSYSERSIRFGVQSVQDRRDALYAQFVELRAKYKDRFAFTAEPYLRQMGYDAGYMFAVAQELLDVESYMPISGSSQKQNKRPGRPKIDISAVIPDNKNYNLVIERILEAVTSSNYDKALAVADEIRLLQNEDIIIKDLDKRVKCLYDFLAAEIPNLPCYRNVVDNIL